MAEPQGSVFVTGALGFIGRALCECFRSQGAEVRGVDLTAAPELGVVAGDVSEAGSWQEHAAGCDLFMHTAAVISMRNDFDPVWRANVLGTRRALDAARASGAGRFVHLSSIVAFSFDYPDGVTEAHPLRTNGVPYVDTKVTSEQVVLQVHAAGELACTIVRPGDVYGPGSRPWTLWPVEELAKGRLLLPAMGRGVLSPVYVDNLVDGIVLAATREEGVGQTFTLTDGVGVTTADFFGHYARLLGKRLRPVPTPVARALAAAAVRLPGETEVNPSAVAYVSRKGTYSIEKARSMLGYEPAVGLAEGMRRTVAWLAAEGYGAGA